MELNKEQLQFLLDKRNDKYGGFGSFIGMCLNQAEEYAKPFEEVLKRNINRLVELNKQIDEYEKELKAETNKKTNIEMPEF